MSRAEDEDQRCPEPLGAVELDAYDDSAPEKDNSRQNRAEGARKSAVAGTQ